MTNEELKIKLTELFPSATFDETGEWLTMNIAPVELTFCCSKFFEIKLN